MMKYSLEILEYQVTDGAKEYFNHLKEIFRSSLFLDKELKLAVSGNELNLLDSYNNNVWVKPIQCPGIPKNAWQSDNRILLTTNTEEYHAWGHLGPTLLIDIESGQIIKEIKGSHGKPLGDGKFIVGLEGYDVFDSWLYDRDGEVLQTWRSCGHYIIDEKENIRVIEQDRSSPTNSHVVMLNLDGSIKKGAKLITSSASKPVLLPNNDLVFENSGRIRVLDSNLEEITQNQLLEINDQNSWMFIGNLELIGKDHLLVHILERTNKKKSPITHKTHKWLLRLK